MGYVRDPAVLEAAPVRIFLDIDPGFGQMWRALGLHDMFAGHDAFVTIGEQIGRPGCTIPTCGLDWITHAPARRAGRVAGAASRRRAGVHDGRELARAVRADRVRGRDLRAARARVPQASRSCRAARTRRSRWRSTSTRPRSPTSSCWTRTDGGWPIPRWRRATRGAYRDYVHASQAELMVAKGMYVQTPQRLGQRSEHLLPGERAPSRGAGDRLLGAVPRGTRPPLLSGPRRRRRRVQEIEAVRPPRRSRTGARRGVLRLATASFRR